MNKKQVTYWSAAFKESLEIVVGISFKFYMHFRQTCRAHILGDSTPRIGKETAPPLLFRLKNEVSYLICSVYKHIHKSLSYAFPGGGMADYIEICKIFQLKICSFAEGNR